MTILSIDRLQEMGAFTGAPVEREITWKQNGEERTDTVFIRRLSYQTAVEEIKAINAKQDNVAARIAASICDAEGKPILTIQDITGEADPNRGPLNGNLTYALLTEIGVVNNLGKENSQS